MGKVEKENTEEISSLERRKIGKEKKVRREREKEENGKRVDVPY